MKVEAGTRSIEACEVWMRTMNSLHYPTSPSIRVAVYGGVNHVEAL